MEVKKEEEKKDSNKSKRRNLKRKLRSFMNPESNLIRDNKIVEDKENVAMNGKT